MYILLFVCGVFTSLNLSAQDSVQAIDLETALKLGGANNLTVQKYVKLQQLEMANYKVAKEWWLPDFYAGTTVHQLWGNAMNGNGAIFQDVNRQNFWAGVGINATWDFGNGIFKTNAADLKVKAAEFKNVSEKNSALLEIIDNYYDFIAAQLYYSAYQKLSWQADSIAVQIGVQVQAELTYESNWLMAKSNAKHIEVQMLQAQSTYNDKSAALIRLLNLDPRLKLVGTDTILAPLTLTDSTTETNFETAYQKSPEIQGLDLLMQSLHEEKKTTTTGLYLPELRVGTYGSMFGDVFSPINPTSEINAALIWRLPVGRMKNGGEKQQFDARIALKETEILTSKAEINEELVRSKSRIETFKKQARVALEGSEFAERALKQSIDRQNEFTVVPLEILQIQEMYITSRLDYLKAVAGHNKAQYSYHVAAGNNL
ncbi:MAG: outer membrane protein TolC [Parvicellaceae bacterium]|jgi:outer membrane protein TolC